MLGTYERWPLKVVTGYPGFNDVLIAIERGEVDGMFTHEGSVQTSRPDMIASGALKPIVQSFDNLPNVPLLTDVIVDGRAKALLGLVTTPSHIGLPLIGPPGMASDRLDILRKSYLRLMADDELHMRIVTDYFGRAGGFAPAESKRCTPRDHRGDPLLKSTWRSPGSSRRSREWRASSGATSS